MNSIFDTLLSLPLFNGVDRDRISAVAGNTKLHFLKYPAGEKIISVGDRCDHIVFILKGRVMFSIQSDSARFRLTYTLADNSVVAPEYLFGMSNSYPFSAVTVEPTSILQIAKEDYLAVLNSDRIFLINYLNALAVNAQTGVDGILSMTSGDLLRRIAYWVKSLTRKNSDDITIHCRLRDLHTILNVQRSTLISALDTLADWRIIDYTNDTITILSRRDLVALLVED
ncbi:MAG: Crp/Fnr family transcriptional regulator [Muribaculaceae bacterium]|nr:Crp/Fnr family transcriptional regulator [Muribaculaceae bacterium]